jgi:hypothetical protein
MTQTKLAFNQINGNVVSVLDFGAVGDGVTSDQSAIDSVIYRFGIDHAIVRIPKGDYPMTVFRPSNVTIFADEGARILLSEDATPVMGQINDDVSITGLTIESTETDLDNQRVTLENANRVYLKRCKIVGFRDVTGSVDAWGLYLNNCTDVVIDQCGFDDNSQSDIAIVDNVENVSIRNCYAIDAALHINLEPNASTNYNRNISIENTDMTKLSLLENGSGGTASESVSIKNCTIGTLIYDGAKATFENCKIDDFDQETIPFFGEVVFKNTLALGPNLIEDPYFLNVAFSSVDAATDSNQWYMNSRTGSIGTNQLDPLEENGIRFTRINPNSLSGNVNFRPTNPISATSGDDYLILVTGRRFAGSDGAFMQIYDGSTDRSCRIFRQSNLGNDYFTTECLILTAAATNDFLIKIGTYQTTTSGFDIAAVSVHKILGQGGGEDAIINSIHSNLYGVRELLPVSTLPTFSNADVRTVQAGDRASLSTTGAIYYWGGSDWVQAVGSDGDTGGTGSAGAGNQYVELNIAGTTYKILHDGTV